MDRRTAKDLHPMLEGLAVLGADRVDVRGDFEDV
jgi:hypothetical protein